MLFLLANVDNLKKENNKIIGYGSPAKATTALNFFGVTNQIDFIIEDNRLKHNKFVPGVKIPIFSKNKIKKKVNQILVLAWNFFDEIKKNNSNLLLRDKAQFSHFFYLINYWLMVDSLKK